MKIITILTRVFSISILMSISVFYASAQEESKPSIGLIQLDTDGMNQDPQLLTDLCRSNLYQLKQFVVMDKYDIDYILKDKDFDLTDCYGSICLAQVGKLLRVDKVLSGSIYRYPKKFTIRLRVIDVNNQIVEKDQVMDFLKLDNQISEMFEVSLKKMFDMPVDTDYLASLTVKDNYNNTINTPETNRLSLSGPRAGLVVLTGNEGRIISGDRESGGFDSRPVMFQFGYQFEVSYLNSGNIQALFEFIPTISGIDQGRFIPSFTLLNGIRNNKNGFEFAFGPVILISQKALGFYHNNEWYLKDERSVFPNEKIYMEKRLDSRGEIAVDAGLVFAIGKTFRSGNINFPINLFSIVKKKDFQFGISVGFNGRN